ncbi:hypothetical protein [uncultured Clostridium sp.]|uniref:hypothetical protein n=1 Tax=uncultured Clostridium sp. TaxID=59620 RepID=UPI0028EC59C7|nr:hypothetical protein [uncultured Clostridium sp.]
MSAKPISFSIDITNDDTKYLINNIMEGDDLKFTISIYQDSANLNLSGQTINVLVRRANGNDTEIESGSNRLTVSDNSLTVFFSDDYLVTDASGDCKLEIVLTDSSGGSTTNTCIFTVKESLQSNLIVKLDDKIDTLEKINTFINNFNLSKDELEAANTLAQQNISTLSTKNSEAITNAERLETDITNGTEVAERLESDIVIGNQLDSNLKQDITTGTALHNNLLINIANGNYTVEQLKGVNWPYIQSMFDLFEKTLENQDLTDENDVDLTDENDVVLLF